MTFYLTVKTLHIVSATILFGTGLGTAFFMFRTRFAGELREKLFAARSTVAADFCFTAPAAIVQPLTGFWLVRQAGYDWTDAWLVATYVLYLVAGLCWLPVVWIQIELKRMIQQSLASGDALPERYHRLFRIWFLLGWPAFIALLIVFFLMVMKPAWQG